MSPEQCLGQTIDCRCDLYSFGCVIFEALTGAPPLVGENALSTMMKHQSEKPLSLKEASMGIEFPKRIEEIVECLLEKDPALRYQSAQHLTADLVGLDSGQISIFDSAPRPLSEFKHQKRQSMPVMIFAAICCIAMGILTGLIVKSVNATQEKVTNVTATPGNFHGMVNDQAAKVKEEKKEENQKVELFEKLSQEKGFFSHPGKITGERIFNFPEFAIGNLHITNKKFFPARGEIRISDFQGIWFAPSQLFQKHPKLFQKFRADDIRALDLRSMAGAMNIDENDFKATNSALSGISTLKGISAIDLGDTVITEEALMNVDKLPNLKTLLLTRVNLNGSQIAKLNCLNKLKEFKLIGIRNIKPVIEKISTSKNLQILIVSDCDIDAAALKRLADTKSLIKLEVANNDSLNDDAVPSIPKNVKDIDLRKCPITGKSLKALIALKNLQNIRMEKTGWSDKQIAELKSHKTSVTVFDRSLEM